MPYGDKKSYSFFKMKYQGNNSAFPFKSPLKHPHRTWKEAGTHDHNYINYKNLDTQGKKIKPKAKPVKEEKK